MRCDVDVGDLQNLVLEVERLKERELVLLTRNTELVELARRQSIRAHVAQFHRAVGQPVLERPQVPPEDRVRLRLRLIAEEFFEVLEACGINFTLQALKCSVLDLIDEEGTCVDLPALADALCDIDYVVEGTRLEFGIYGPGVLAEVQRANLAKQGGLKRVDGKQMKPEGWQGPDIARVLREQGWLGT